MDGSWSWSARDNDGLFVFPVPLPVEENPAIDGRAPPRFATFGRSISILVPLRGKWNLAKEHPGCICPFRRTLLVSRNVGSLVGSRLFYVCVLLPLLLGLPSKRRPEPD